MALFPVSDFLGDSAALCDAVVRLRGPALVAELGRIASTVMASPLGQFLPAASTDAAAPVAPFPRDTPALLQEISFDGHCFGH
ncbi:MAG: GGDEF domain-containing protein, partial [Janthinobacterium sp.]